MNWVIVFIAVLIVGVGAGLVEYFMFRSTTASPCGSFPECNNAEGCRGCEFEGDDQNDGRPRAFGGAA